MAYTNSPLAVMTQISPFNSGTRNHVIDTITPHCYVGQASIESAGRLFQTSGASCQYTIGADGRVILICPEEYRSWCTSSAENDNRAVTIECASDATAPYAFNDKVWASLINLCIDICQRNGKKKLLWLGTKEATLAYQPKFDEMVLTAHRWFAAKGCPGDWMYAREGQLAEAVTKALGGTTPTVTPVTPDMPIPTPSFPIENPEKAIWNYFRGKGLNDYATAGLMGNLYSESGLNSQNLQNSYERTLGMNDVEYTLAVDSGKYSNFAMDGAGYGLAQWTYHTRKQSLLHYARTRNESIGSLTMQLDFLWQELQGYTAVTNVLNTASSVSIASDAVLTGFEKPADQSASVKAKRASFGQVYYDRYAGSKPTVITLYRVRKSWSDSYTQKGAFTDIQNAKKCADANPGYHVYDNDGKALYPASTTTYTVRVTANVLMIRKGAGTNYPVVGEIADKGIYTITEESTGTGASLWGKLKSGAGWIALDYTKKVRE